MSGKCPKCETPLSSVNIEEIQITHFYQPRWRGISYLCPSCNSVLGVQIDPIAIKTDLLNEISDVLRGKKQ